MVYIPNFIPEHFHKVLRKIRRNVMKLMVKRPLLSVAIILLAFLAILPILTALVLQPISFIFTYTGILASQGFSYIVYNIIIGLIVGTMLVVLFLSFFSTATLTSVLMSYRIRKNS